MHRDSYLVPAADSANFFSSPGGAHTAISTEGERQADQRPFFPKAFCMFKSKEENDRRNFFMINLHKSMRPGLDCWIELATPGYAVGLAT